MKGVRDTQKATQEFVNSLQSMAQHSRQASLNEIQQSNEEIVALQTAISLLKQTTKKDSTEVRELITDLQQRERRRQQDRDIAEDEFKFEINRRLQVQDSRLSDIDQSASIQATREALNKLLVWQGEIGVLMDQQQRGQIAVIESIRKVRMSLHYCQ